MPSSTITEESKANSEIGHLTRAFELFSKKTARLETAYTELKHQFTSVNLELEQTNRKLQEKVEEIDAALA